MTSPPRDITITCPQCGHVYTDWHRPSINVTLDHFDAEYLDAATSSICPRCGLKVSHDVLIVDMDSGGEA